MASRASRSKNDANELKILYVNEQYNKIAKTWSKGAWPMEPPRQKKIDVAKVFT